MSTTNDPPTLSTEPSLATRDNPLETVFAMEEIQIPRQCEKCKIGRPRVVLVRRMMGQSMSAVLCTQCGAKFKAQASEVAEALRAKLEAEGRDVQVD